MHEERIDFIGSCLQLHSVNDAHTLVGPNGSGKSRLVKTFAKTQGIEMTSLCAGTWIPLGARGEDISIHRLINNVRRSEEGIVFLVEIDKLTHATEWTRGIHQEIFALIDGRFHDISAWDKSLTRKFQAVQLPAGDRERYGV